MQAYRKDESVNRSVKFWAKSGKLLSMGIYYWLFSLWIEIWNTLDKINDEVVNAGIILGLMLSIFFLCYFLSKTISSSIIFHNCMPSNDAMACLNTTETLMLLIRKILLKLISLFFHFKRDAGAIFIINFLFGIL